MDSNPPKGQSMPAEQHISNPFLVSINTLIKILKVNPGPALLVSLYYFVIFLLTYIITVFLSVVMPVASTIFAFVVMITISVILVGMAHVIAIASVQKEKVSLTIAFELVFNRILPLTALGVISTLLLLAGFIMLIIPGFYVLGRIALAPVVFFEESLGPITSIKRSFELTKGHAIEMIGASLAGSFLVSVYGLLFIAAAVAPNIGRYQGLKMLKTTRVPKPKVHWLNYGLPGFTVAFFFILVGFFTLLMINAPPDSDQPRIQQELQYETPTQDTELLYPQ